ncbi:serine/threonine protein kinase [Oscillatoriales cyanobacterium USR001]|nr:serine/threonine protein kinase [Oscillatoriales cyanobacterium USR001]
MPQPLLNATHCINPDCPRPYPQTWGNNFCQSCGAPLRLLNRYIPLQRLGIGGFAAIYTVWDLQTQTERVLKVLLESSPKALELFEQEAWMLASLRHPGIPRIESDCYFNLELRIPTYQGSFSKRRFPCLLMEKIHGKTLQDILDEYPEGCPESWVLNWLIQAVEILQELHGRNIIHRDIKPSNLMLREESGQLVMIDFGGAKQMGIDAKKGGLSSTRLISPGYSPLEQIVGGAVGPAADFYALGRTCIHLLTGKYPADLEDPLTGELRWRHIAPHSYGLANLLDDMVRSQARERPVSAAQIRDRLHKISISNNSTNLIVTTGQNLLKFTWEILTTLVEGVTNLTAFIFSAIAQTVVASLDTAWEMMLGGLGGTVGALSGLIIIYWSPLGKTLVSLLNLGLHQFVPGVAFNVGPEILLFSLAGLGTAFGLTDAGGFRQRRRYWLAGVTGMLGYGLAGLCWVAGKNYGTIEEMMLVGTIAIASLTLGMGLRSHHAVHALVSAIAPVAMFAAINTLNIFPHNFLSFLLVNNNYPNWAQFCSTLIFFGLMGSGIGLCLGVSHYLIIPLLRWLGWR